MTSRRHLPAGGFDLVTDQLLRLMGSKAVGDQVTDLIVPLTAYGPPLAPTVLDRVVPVVTGVALATNTNTYAGIAFHGVAVQAQFVGPANPTIIDMATDATSTYTTALSNPVVFTMPENHGVPAGQVFDVVIAGDTHAPINGTWRATSLSASTFSVAFDNTGGVIVDDGTADIVINRHGYDAIDSADRFLVELTGFPRTGGAGPATLDGLHVATAVSDSRFTINVNTVGSTYDIGTVVVLHPCIETSGEGLTASDLKLWRSHLNNVVAYGDNAADDGYAGVTGFCHPTPGPVFGHQFTIPEIEGSVMGYDRATADNNRKMRTLISGDPTRPMHVTKGHLEIGGVDQAAIVHAANEPRVNITLATIANPTIVTVDFEHGIPVGGTATVVIWGSDSTPTLDGTRTATGVSAREFSLPINVTIAGSTGVCVVDPVDVLRIRAGTFIGDLFAHVAPTRALLLDATEGGVAAGSCTGFVEATRGRGTFRPNLSYATAEQSGAGTTTIYTVPATSRVRLHELILWYDGTNYAWVSLDPAGAGAVAHPLAYQGVAGSTRIKLDHLHDDRATAVPVTGVIELEVNTAGNAFAILVYEVIE